ncbi:PREDICTED: guanine deaminase isoform X3 [Papilio polytes]|uniref:guanine deaminase isoform X3 n=1 Tax=Papilio polytes TaxID=76194 RepID=UPI0006766937|nr:PREDICTED: guanine deaminase isoform X3 [Papilio polytes]
MFASQEKVVFVGTIVSSSALDRLNILKGFIAIENGKIIKIGSIEELSTNFSKELLDFEKVILNENQLLIPGFVDCHTHAPQFPNIGLGLDRPLLEWLDKYTFPLESKYDDVNFAKSIYRQVVQRLINSGTTTACYFGSLHLEGTLALVDSAIEHGQRALVGKVSMNIKNDAGYYNDTAKELNDVECFVQKVLEHKNDLVHPVVTPRFAVSCDAALMTGLSDIANRYGCRIQSHISENREEIKHVLNINPGCTSYSEVYDKSHILNNKCIMAHAVYLREEEMCVLLSRGVSVAHCPASNTRLRSGLCPVRALIEAGLTVGLGTDVSGGDSSSILDAMRRAMDVSTHLEMLDTTSVTRAALNWREVFYLATLGGAKALRLDDKIGNFEVGKDFDAQVIDVFANGGQIDSYEYTMEGNEHYRVLQLLQRFIYLGDDRNITQVYIKGRKVKG